MSARKPPEWEVRISVYRNGRRVMVSDALGGYPETALYDAHNDLELWAEVHPESYRRTHDEEATR